MRAGVPPQRVARADVIGNLSHGTIDLEKSEYGAAPATLLTTHGYCPGKENPWSTRAQDFTNAAFFLEKGSNMRNDEFAKKLGDYAQSNAMSSFSIVSCIIDTNCIDCSLSRRTRCIAFVELLFLWVG